MLTCCPKDYTSQAYFQGQGGGRPSRTQRCCEAQTAGAPFFCKKFSVTCGKVGSQAATARRGRPFGNGHRECCPPVASHQRATGKGPPKHSSRCSGAYLRRRRRRSGWPRCSRRSRSLCSRCHSLGLTALHGKHNFWISEGCGFELGIRLAQPGVLLRMLVQTSLHFVCGMQGGNWEAWRLCIRCSCCLHKFCRTNLHALPALYALWESQFSQYLWPVTLISGQRGGWGPAVGGPGHMPTASLATLRLCDSQCKAWLWPFHVRQRGGRDHRWGPCHVPSESTAPALRAKPSTARQRVAGTPLLEISVMCRRSLCFVKRALTGATGPFQ